MVAMTFMATLEETVPYTRSPPGNYLGPGLTPKGCDVISLREAVKCTGIFKSSSDDSGIR